MRRHLMQNRSLQNKMLKIYVVSVRPNTINRSRINRTRILINRLQDIYVQATRVRAANITGQHFRIMIPTNTLITTNIHHAIMNNRRLTKRRRNINVQVTKQERPMLNLSARSPLSTRSLELAQYTKLNTSTTVTRGQLISRMQEYLVTSKRRRGRHARSAKRSRSIINRRLSTTSTHGTRVSTSISSVLSRVSSILRRGTRRFITDFIRGNNR